MNDKMIKEFMELAYNKLAAEMRKNKPLRKELMGKINHVDEVNKIQIKMDVVIHCNCKRA